LARLTLIGGEYQVVNSPKLTGLSLTVNGHLDRVDVFGNGVETVDLSLDDVFGFVAIAQNSRLTSANVTVGHLSGLAVGSNPSLTELVLDAEQIAGTVAIQNNEQLHGIDLQQSFSIHGSLILSGPFDDTFSTLLTVDGDCTIRNTRMTKLTQLFSVGGTLDLIDNAELTGTIKVFSIGGLSLVGSPAMEVLSLETPQTEIPGSVVIGGNAALRDVGSLGNITSIGSTLALVNSPALVTTPRFVTLVGANLVLQNLPNLVDLGLDNLERVGALLEVDGLLALQTIALPALVHASDILVTGNPELGHLGLPALASANMIVADNRHLPACQVAALFARVTGTHLQERNDETTTCTAPQ
jgi:hypothetical protein